MTKDIKTTIRMTETTKERLKQLAELLDITESQAIRVAIATTLNLFSRAKNK
jgi:predicted DNA-binding protein